MTDRPTDLSSLPSYQPPRRSLFSARKLALMASVSYQLGRSAIVDWLAPAIAIASLVLLLRFRINSAWLVLGGAIIGIAASMARGG